jgi:tRNA(Arg) A34 adenosine deaminase TadA
MGRDRRGDPSAATLKPPRGDVTAIVPLSTIWVTEADEQHLRRAIELAAEARAAGDMPFGSLLVGPAGEVLVEDRNTVVTGDDITAHPELKTALWASRNLDPAVVAGTTMYTSTEACPMCRGAIARSGLGRVVFVLSAEQFAGLKPLGSPSPDAADVSYEGPSLFDEARVPIEGYYGER